MADSPFIFEIDETNYEEIVLQGSYDVPVLLDFWAGWCQPCQILMPILAKLVDEYRGEFILGKIDTEAQQAIAAQFGIRSIPTVKLFRDGAPVDEFMGALPEAEIRLFLDKHLPRASDGTVAEAQQQLLSGDARGALDLLAEARAVDPENPRILVAMAAAHAAAGDLDAATEALDALPMDEQDKPEARQLRGRLFFDQVAMRAGPAEAVAQRSDSSPDDSEARYQLAAHQVVAGDIEPALDNLLLIMQRDRAFGDDAARRALLKMFDMLGDDPMVTRYRARMFNLLH